MDLFWKETKGSSWSCFGIAPFSEWKCICWCLQGLRNTPRRSRVATGNVLKESRWEGRGGRMRDSSPPCWQLAPQSCAFENHVSEAATRILVFAFVFCENAMKPLASEADPTPWLYTRCRLCLRRGRQSRSTLGMVTLRKKNVKSNLKQLLLKQKKRGIHKPPLIPPQIKQTRVRHHIARWAQWSQPYISRDREKPAQDWALRLAKSITKAGHLRPGFCG